MKGPTERTLAELRRQGYMADVVEKWIPQTKQRKDLFGIIDVVAIGDGETVGVQATSYNGIWDRQQKMQDSEALAALRKAGWRVLIWGWHSKMTGPNKKQKRWVYREVDLS